MTMIWFVTGKGGVGKTSVSSKFAAENLHFHLLGEDEISRKVLAEDFLHKAVKFKALAHLLGQSKLLQTLIGIAPNLHELLYLREITRRAQTTPLIVDAPSTGNFISTLEALYTARDLFESGLLKDLVDETIKMLREPHAVKVSVVSIPEESALSETKQIIEYIKTKWPEFEIELVLNRLHEPSTHPEAWDQPWRDLAIERPERELRRIRIFEEGSGSFARRFHEGDLPT